MSAPAIDVIVQEGLSPAESLAVDAALLDELAASADRARGTLRIHTIAGDVVSLGRYHLPPARPSPDPAVRVARRWSGGRVVATGNGFVGVTLLLPHRSALVGSDPEALAPTQVLNRCVRGILAACEHVGVPALYPGRDLVTVDRRMLGMVSFTVEAGGALVFEAVLGSGRDASVLPRLLDRADPAGDVVAAMIAPADATSIAERAGAPVPLPTLAAAIRRGYAGRLGVALVDREPPAPRPFDERGWLAQRQRRPELPRRASLGTQLGTVEILSARDGARVAAVAIGGDLIAPPATVDAIEDALRGCAVERAPLEDAVRAVLAQPGHFVLGLGPPADVATAIARAVLA
jgi:lipoate-protein ligase A